MRRAVYAIIAITVLTFAAGFPAYLAFGQGGGGNQVTISVSATPLVEPTPPPGGGGAGGGIGETGCPAGTTSTAGRVSNTGKVNTAIVVASPDLRFQLTINEGTIALRPDGSPLNCIGISKTESLPSPPAGAYVISVWYSVTPHGATFYSSATLRYTGEPGTIPAGADGQNLVIAAYNETSGQWLMLPSVVNAQAGTITAGISRWGDLAVFGYAKEAPPPAAFQVSLLGISPTWVVYTGELVNITVLVANSGGQSGSYQVVLKVNGVVEATKEIILGAGTSQQVSFSVSKEAAGSYSVDVNGLTGVLEVRARPVPPPVKHFNWWIIVGIASVLLAALATYIYRVQKQYGGVGVLSSSKKIKLIPLAPKLALKLMAATLSLLKKVMAAVLSLLEKSKSIKIKRGK